MKVKVLSNINSGQFVAGDIAEFPDSEAQALIEAGAVEALAETAPEQPDGFPVHNPVQSAPPAPAAPEAPAANAPLEPSPAASSASSTASSEQSKQPTPEQIANDVAGL